MPVRVTPDDLTRLNGAEYPTGQRFDVDDHGVLRVYDAAGKVVAAHAYGRWGAAEVLQSPDAEPPLLRSGTVVCIPGIDVPYVVDKGLATSGAHATLTFTTVDGRDWSDDRTVNAAAEPEPHSGTTVTTEAVLDVATEPYVSVSASANDADELAKLLRKLIREKGAKSFGLAAS